MEIDGLFSREMFPDLVPLRGCAVFLFCELYSF